ncbi:MAG: TlpA disulfide reductase family protein [Planctomycetota bacterium]|nr:TlpA disulfide reductase family protein [Planctomycetota bacterium]
MTSRHFLLILALSSAVLIGEKTYAGDVDDWNALAKWMKTSRPSKPSKSSMRKYRNEVVSKLEAFVKEHPDYQDRARVELLLGETLLTLPSYGRAKKHFEDMAEGKGDRGVLGRVGILKTLCAQAKLREARLRLNKFLEAHPKEESLLKFDEFLRTNEKGDRVKKAFKKLRKGSSFPPFTGKKLSDGAAWDLSKDMGKVTLIGFWVPFNNGEPVKIGRKELEAATKLHKKYADMGLVVLGVPYDRTPERLKVYVGKLGLEWAQLSNGDKIARDLGVHPFPYWILLGPKGKVIAKDLRGSKLDKAVRAALKKYGD